MSANLPISQAEPQTVTVTPAETPPSTPTETPAKSHGTPIEFEIDLGELEPLWVEAISQALEGSGIEITVSAKPATRCGVEAANDPTGILVGNQSPANVARAETEAQHSEDILALRRADFVIKDGLLTIEEPPFIGQCASSPSGRFVLSWGERTFGAGGTQENKHYLLFDGANIITRGTMKRPVEGIVADNGTFAFNDWAEDAVNTGHVFDCGGELIFKKSFESWAGIRGISADGRFVIWEIIDEIFCAEPNVGSSELPELSGRSAWLLFDLTTRKEAANIYTVLGEATSQQINSEKQIVTFAYANGLTHRYAFDGTFLDAVGWQTAFRNYASGYELLRVAEERLPSLATGDASAIADVIDLLSRALVQEISEYTQARVHRHLGELRLRCGDKAVAIEHLECATRLYPKIGVKKLLATLKQADPHRE